MSEYVLVVLAGIPTIFVALLWYKEHKRLKIAEAESTEAEAELRRAQTTEVEANTLQTLWSQINTLITRMRRLEARVTVLETENRSLKEIIEQFRNLVRRLWAVILENGLSQDRDLVEAVNLALQDGPE